MTRFLVLCAGIGYRWHDYLDLRKHLLPLDGETIVGRTVRLLVENGADEIEVIAPDLPGYDVPGSTIWTPPVAKVTDTSVDKLLSCRDRWNTAGRTVALWGDVWWSEEAIADVVANDSAEFHVWYRPSGSTITGKDHGEFFAHAFLPHEHDREEAACYRVVDLYRRDLIPWKDTGAWTHYRAMLGIPDEMVHGWHDGRNATLVDDWTDDFDHPRDFRGWYGRRTVGRYTSTQIRILGDHHALPLDQHNAALAVVMEFDRPVIPYGYIDPDPRPDLAYVPETSAIYSVDDLPDRTTRLDGERIR